MTYRIVPTYELKWKVQKKKGFFWKDVRKLLGGWDFSCYVVREFDTEKEAEEFIDEQLVKDEEDEKRDELQKLHMLTRPRIYPK